MTTADHDLDPGVSIERRDVLRLGALAAGCFMLDLGLSAPLVANLDDSFEEFTRVWKGLRKELESHAIVPDAFLHRLGGAVAGLERKIPAKQRTAFKNDQMETGPAWFEAPVFIIVLKLQPGAVIYDHQHRAEFVLTLSLEGECHYQHFEPCKAIAVDDFETEFEVKQTRGGILTPGRRTGLTMARDSIHGFQAGPKGATILDLTTTVVKPRIKSGSIVIADKVRDEFLRTHAAHWVPKRVYK